MSRPVAWYNEIDPEAAETLRELIRQGEIAPGDVDERSIEDVTPAELVGYTQRHYFAGGGGWPIAFRLAGWPDSKPVSSGSCPCQPHSAAASERKKGFSDPRDLWPAWGRHHLQFSAIPVFGEQVDDSVAWIDRMHADLEDAGFAVGAVDLPACAADAPTERVRTFFVGIPNSTGFGKQSRTISIAPQLLSVERASGGSFYGDYETAGESGKRRRHQRGVPLLADGFPGRVAVLRQIGNAINPRLAQGFIEAAIEILKEEGRW